MTLAAQDTGFETRCKTGDASILLAVEDEWRALVSTGPCNEPFFQPYWVGSYLAAFVPEAQVVLIEIVEDGQLSALLPLVSESIYSHALPIRSIRGASGVHSCRFDVIRNSEITNPLMMQTLWKSIAAASHWERFVLRDIPRHSGSRTLLEAARADGYHVGVRPSIRSPRIDFPVISDPDQAWLQLQAGLGSRFRSSLRQWWRRLEALGPVNIACHINLNDSVLERFFALEKSGWKGQEQTAISSSPNTSSFYNLIAATSSNAGTLRLYELTVAGKTVAMQLGLVMGETYFMPKVAYDEAYRACAPGHVLMGEVLHDCVNQRMRSFDCLGDADEWKCRWTRQLVAHENWFIYPPSPLGTYLYAVDFPFRDAAKKLVNRFRRSRSATAT